MNADDDVPRMPENIFPTIGENWAHFERIDIAPTAPKVQRDEMQRAFYAGAATGLAQACFAHYSGDFAGELSKLIAEVRTWKALRVAQRTSRSHG